MKPLYWLPIDHLDELARSDHAINGVKVKKVVPHGLNFTEFEKCKQKGFISMIDFTLRRQMLAICYLALGSLARICLLVTYILAPIEAILRKVWVAPAPPVVASRTLHVAVALWNDPSVPSPALDVVKWALISPKVKELTICFEGSPLSASALNQLITSIQKDIGSQVNIIEITSTRLVITFTDSPVRPIVDLIVVFNGYVPGELPVDAKHTKIIYPWRVREHISPQIPKYRHWLDALACFTD